MEKGPESGRVIIDGNIETRLLVVEEVELTNTKEVVIIRLEDVLNQ